MFQVISPIDAHRCHNVCNSLHVVLLHSILCHVGDLEVCRCSINTDMDNCQQNLFLHLHTTPGFVKMRHIEDLGIVDKDEDVPTVPLVYYSAHELVKVDDNYMKRSP